MPWFGAAAGAVGSALGSAGSAIGTGLASAGSAIGSAAGTAASTIGSAAGSVGSALGSAGSALGSGIANAGYGIGNAAGGALSSLTGSGVTAAAPAAVPQSGGLLSAMAPAKGMSAGANMGGLSSSMLAPQPAPTFGAAQIANPVSGLSSGAQNAGVFNPFGLDAASVPTWGQRTFGNNAVGQGIDQTLAMVDPRASSPQLAEARMGMLKNMAGDQLKSGIKEQMNFSPPPAMPQRQVQQQQINNVNPYSVNALNRFNRRLTPFGGA